jgi:hypothetical protein
MTLAVIREASHVRVIADLIVAVILWRILFIEAAHRTISIAEFFISPVAFVDRFAALRTFVETFVPIYMSTVYIRYITSV